ncbi:serine/threonine-protein kinase [Microbacterium telephonicum]|uniref:non-specific serine/threonine protein kinase n=1 Tax=Microbacterium telephonicum TaxID=1714841 RepID=A0A498C781_9MICO|nr:serine/threonine-protein kinase [Microbacterium telephonicum]RLK48930.1 serine/threonine protein kinase [Microbacterium telephonicum]
MAGRLPSAPPVLAGFTYVRPLGTGGFADVFLFEQNLPRRPVAVKVLLRDIVDEGLLRMFNAEADIMARLSSHPSILTIYEAGISADGRPYLVMEFCPTSLTTRYRREVIPVAEVLQIGIKVSSALETAHRSGLLHRDIKPSNILVTTFGAPVLSDFGIAAAVGGREGADEVFAMSVPWSAPEIIDEKISGSIAAEVWGLGATVYSLLAGHSPFERPGSGQNTREALKTRIRRATYTPTGRGDVPADLEAVLARAMHKDPGARHATAVEFAQDLQSAQLALGLPATPLEVAHDEWAAAGGAIDFADDRPRGPSRPTVEYVSPRPRRAPAAPTRRAPDDGTVLAGSEPARRSRLPLVLSLSGAAILLLGGAAALVAMLWGGG